MSLFNSFKVAGSGMYSQTQRLNTVASNIANAETVANSEDTVYQARKVVFEAQLKRAMGNQASASAGVAVKEVTVNDSPAKKVYDPSSPLADNNGYVYLPNVNIAEEIVDMISSSRSYQASAEVMNTSKQLMLKTLNLGG